MRLDLSRVFIWPGKVVSKTWNIISNNPWGMNVTCFQEIPDDINPSSSVGIRKRSSETSQKISGLMIRAKLIWSVEEKKICLWFKPYKLTCEAGNDRHGPGFCNRTTNIYCCYNLWWWQQDSFGRGQKHLSDILHQRTSGVENGRCQTEQEQNDWRKMAVYYM